MSTADRNSIAYGCAAVLRGDGAAALTGNIEHIDAGYPIVR